MNDSAVTALLINQLPRQTTAAWKAADFLFRRLQVDNGTHERRFPAAELSWLTVFVYGRPPRLTQLSPLALRLAG
jgi:hypothetical protein